MNQKKNKKVIIILMVVIILIIGIVGAALAYFSTDIFKSKKELFFKYASQIGDKENGFVDEKLIQYFEKKGTTPYENEGTFSVELSPEDNTEKIETANQFNIEFTGKVDNTASKANQDISINYSDNVKFPISYRKIGSAIGLQTKYVGSKYIVEEDNLDDIFNNLDFSTSNIMNDTDILNGIKSIEFNQEEQKYLNEKYTKLVSSKLDSDKFTVVENVDSKGYRLSLTGNEIKDLMKSFLEELKNDQVTLNKLNEYIKQYDNSAEITQDGIDELIKDIDENTDADFENEKLDLTIYVKNKKVNKIEIAVNEATFSIEKAQTGNDLQYNISTQISGDDNETFNIYFNAKYTGLQLLQSIGENYEIGLSLSSGSSQSQYKYFLNNNINFVENSEIENFSDDNAIILSEYSEEQVDGFMQAVFERIAEVNKMHMEKIGFDEDEHPIMYMIPTFAFSTTSNIMSNQQDMHISINMDEEEVNSFNEKFEMYEGTNQKGVTVKGLLTVINSNNTTYEDEQIEEIHFNGDEYEATEQNIVLIKSEVEAEENYKIEFEKDEDTGKIYRVVINKK